MFLFVWSSGIIVLKCLGRTANLQKRKENSWYKFKQEAIGP